MTPIPKEQIETARRKMCRRLAAVVINCMAETDTSFPDLARRSGMEEAKLRKFVWELVDGISGDKGLDNLSDITTAMAAEIAFTLRPYRDVAAEYAAAEEAAAAA